MKIKERREGGEAGVEEDGSYMTVASARAAIELGIVPLNWLFARNLGNEDDKKGEENAAKKMGGRAYKAWSDKKLPKMLGMVPEKSLVDKSLANERRIEVIEVWISLSKEFKHALTSHSAT